MSLDDLQKQVDEWAQQLKIPYWQPHEILARLAEETGELAREINHMFGPKKKKPTEDTRELGLEMADILFTLVCLANSRGINLQEAWQGCMDKCYGRDRERYARKDITENVVRTDLLSPGTSSGLQDNASPSLLDGRGEGKTSPAY